MLDWDKKREIMHNYDSSATAYDRQYTEEQTAKIMTVLLDMGRNKVPFALDDGCGTGLLFKHVRRFSESLVGIDFSSKLLKKAKKRAKRFYNIAVVRADADHLPFPNQTFNAAFALTLLQNMLHPIETLHEMERVCKHRSTLVVTGLKKEFSLEEFESLLDVAELEISLVETKDQLKDYVAMCRSP